MFLPSTLSSISYSSCKVAQLQLASICRGAFFFLSQPQCWKVTFIWVISLEDNENRDCLQRLSLWKWGNQCFGGALTATRWMHVYRNADAALRASMSSQIEDRVPYPLLLSIWSSLLERNHSTFNRCTTCWPDVFE